MRNTNIILILTLFALINCNYQWGTYRPGSIFTLVNTQSPKQNQIEVGYLEGLQQSSLILTEDETSDSRYIVHDGSTVFQKIITTKAAATLQIKGILDNSPIVNVEYLNQSVNTTLYLLINPRIFTYKSNQICSGIFTTLTSLHQFDPRIRHSDQKQQREKNMLLTCEITSNFSIQISPITSSINFEQAFKERVSIFQAKVLNFMYFYKIEPTPTQIQIVQFGISTTVGRIACIKSRLFELYYMVLENPSQHTNDLKLTPLIYQLLSHFDPALASVLAQSTVELLEDEIYYAKQSKRKIPIPEHIEFLEYFNNSKSVKILNSLIFDTLFKNINRIIGKEADYLATKQIHPLIRVMLEINWESDYQYQKSLSIYKQSFFEDLYLNSQEQVQEISVSKVAWLLKTVQAIRRLDTQKSLSFTQLDSLEYNIKDYLRGQCFQKNSKVIRSINKVGKNRYYTITASYDNIMPHVYGAYPKYEQAYDGTLRVLMNLTTPLGVASLEKCPVFDLQYKYRGNISPYFNYKILQMLEREQKIDEKQLKSMFRSQKIDPEDGLQNIKRVIRLIRKRQTRLIELLRTSLKNKVLDDWKNYKKLFGRWTPTGYSFESSSQLILINCLFLR